MQDESQNPTPGTPQPDPTAYQPPPPEATSYPQAPAAPGYPQQPTPDPAQQQWAQQQAYAPQPAQPAYPPPGQPGAPAAPGYGQPAGYPPPGAPDPNQAGYAQPGYGQPGYGQPGQAQPGYYQQPGTPPPGAPQAGGYYQQPGAPPPGGYYQQQPGQGPNLGYAASEDWEKFRQEFTKIDFDKVIPLGAWVKDKPWNLVWVRWFLAYALFPFLLLKGSSVVPLETAAWGFGIYFALTWMIVLTLCIKPEKMDLPVLAGVSAFTALIGIPIVLFAQRLPIISSLYQASDNGNVVVRLFGFIFGVGVMEETCKALPILLLLYAFKKTEYRPLTFAYLAAVSGFAFGVKEAVGYSVHNYANIVAENGPAALGIYVTVQLLRLISLPLLHGCWSGIAGYFIGLASRHKTAPRALIITGLGIAMVLHGFYDTFADGWFGVVLAALTILVFISYIRSGDVISKEILAQELGTTPESAGAVPTAAAAG
jgi:RsiW-degrading membrane proteinase PrsW (M82 family)